MNNEEKVFKKLSSVFGGVDNNNEMLKNAVTIQYQLQKVIEHLSIEEQYNIIYQVTLLVYQAWYSGFEHIINFKE